MVTLRDTLSYLLYSCIRDILFLTSIVQYSSVSPLIDKISHPTQHSSYLLYLIKRQQQSKATDQQSSSSLIELNSIVESPGNVPPFGMKTSGPEEDKVMGRGNKNSNNKWHNSHFHPLILGPMNFSYETNSTMY